MCDVRTTTRNARVESWARTESSGMESLPGLVSISWPGLSYGEEMAKNLVLSLWMRHGIGMMGRYMLRFGGLLWRKLKSWRNQSAQERSTYILFSSGNRSFNIDVPVVINDQSVIDNFQRGHMSATSWGPKSIIKIDLGLWRQDGIASN